MAWAESLVRRSIGIEAFGLKNTVDYTDLAGRE